MSGYDRCATQTQSMLFFFSSRRRHTRSVSAFLLNRSSDLMQGVEFDNGDMSEAALWPSTYISPLSNSTPCIRKDRISSRSEERRVGKECRARGSLDH